MKQNRVINAVVYALKDELMEVVEEVHNEADFVEVAGSIGGDSVRYRVYDNGEIIAE